MTYFVCATPHAQPFIEFQPKKSSSHRTSRRISLPRLSRHRIRGMREMRIPAHGSALQSRCKKVFDFHSATMQQQLESMRNNIAGDERPPKHLQQLKLVFVRHCLQALRLPRTAMEFTDQLALSSSLSNEEAAPAPAPPAVQVDDLPIFKSAARSELGLYVSRRQEFYLRRARRRRKVMWKPVLQSISEMAPIVEFHSPALQEETESAVSKRFSPPRPDYGAPPPPRKNISPPRQPVKIISPPRQQQASVAAKHSAPPLRRTRGNNNRSLYMA